MRSMRRAISSNVFVVGLPLEDIDFVDVHRPSIAEQCEYDRKPHGCFACGDCHNEEDKELTADVSEKLRSAYEHQVHRVEHHLDGHEHNDCIPPSDDTNGADGKEHRCQDEIPFEGDGLEIHGLTGAIRLSVLQG